MVSFLEMSIRKHLANQFRFFLPGLITVYTEVGWRLQTSSLKKLICKSRNV